MAYVADAGGTSAADKARALLAAGAGPSQAGPAVSTGTTYQIPIKVGSYKMPVNQGMFDDDPRTHVDLKESKDSVDRFDLTDDGVNAAMGTWYSFDDQDREALAKKMWYLGLLKDPSDFDGAYTVWKKAVEHSARFALTGREIDPRDVLDIMGDAESGANVKKQGPITRRQVDLTDPETARAWISEAFRQSMGRAPEEAEIRAMVDAIGDKERANPTVSTTTPTKWDDQGNAIDSTTSTTGGFDSQAYLRNQIDADPEAGAHQAAADLFPALMQALGSG